MLAEKAAALANVATIRMVATIAKSFMVRMEVEVSS